MSTLGLSLRTRQTIAWIIFLGFICLALLTTKKPKSSKPLPPNGGSSDHTHSKSRQETGNNLSGVNPVAARNWGNYSEQSASGIKALVTRETKPPAQSYPIVEIYTAKGVKR